LANPKLNPTKVTNMILATASAQSLDASQKSRSGERFWETQDRSLLTAVVSIAVKAIAAVSPHEVLTFERLNMVRAMLNQPEKELRDWVKRIVGEIGTTNGMPLLEYAALPDSTRGCVAASVGALLEPFVQPPLCWITQPELNRPSIELQSVFTKGKVIVVNTANAEDALEMLPIQMLLAMAWSQLVLARPRLDINQTRPVWTVIDEAARVISSRGDPASDIMDMARSSRCGVILAFQNLSALHASLGNSYAVHRLVALAANHVYLANNDPVTAAQAAVTLGTRRKYRLHREVHLSSPPPLLFPDEFDDREEEPASGLMVPTEEPMLPAAELAKLKPGEMWLVIAGQVHHLQADVTTS
jgi:type IV secretory pathway TraG/TraD family ATPase VirD4